MYRVMIVEDFPADMAALTQMLRAMDDVEIVAACANGQEAVSLIPEARPHILISDIDMPLMDGFELARRVRGEFPAVKIIFCSFHREFEYARQALYLDGYGYVLKPVDPKELRGSIVNVMERVEDEAHGERRRRELERLLEKDRSVLADDLIRSLVYGISASEEEICETAAYLGLPVQKGPYALALAEVDDYHAIARGMHVEERQLLSVRVLHQLRQMADAEHFLVGALSEARFVVIHSGEGQSMDQWQQSLAQLTRDALLAFSRTDVSLTFALGGHTDRLEQIAGLYEQALYALRCKYTYGKGQIISYQDIPYARERPEIDLNKLQKDLRFLLSAATAEQCEQFVALLFRRFGPGDDVGSIQDLCFQLAIAMQTVLHERKEDFSVLGYGGGEVWPRLLSFETAQDAQLWLSELARAINLRFAEQSGKQKRQVVDSVKTYIREQFSRDISVDEIADALHYSSDYLNLLFKQATGESIHGWLCQHKIELAKQMLKDTRLKLYEITDRLGFSHAAYFNSFFKKYTGLTPKEYREGGHEIP